MRRGINKTQISGNTASDYNINNTQSNLNPKLITSSNTMVIEEHYQGVMNNQASATLQESGIPTDTIRISDMLQSEVGNKNILSNINMFSNQNLNATNVLGSVEPTTHNNSNGETYAKEDQ